MHTCKPPLRVWITFFHCISVQFLLQQACLPLIHHTHNSLLIRWRCSRYSVMASDSVPPRGLAGLLSCLISFCCKHTEYVYIILLACWERSLDCFFGLSFFNPRDSQLVNRVYQSNYQKIVCISLYSQTQSTIVGIGCSNRSIFVFNEENFIRKYAKVIIEWGYPFSYNCSTSATTGTITPRHFTLLPTNESYSHQY